MRERVSEKERGGERGRERESESESEREREKGKLTRARSRRYVCDDVTLCM